MMSGSHIKLEYISKTYKDETVLNIEEYTIPLENKIVAIIGFSGNGKTTLLNMIGLLDIPDEKFIDNQDKTPKITYYIDDKEYEVHTKAIE